MTSGCGAGGVLPWISPLATAVVGGAGIVIAWQQRRIADRQRQNAEFDTIFSIFSAFLNAALQASADEEEAAPIVADLQNAHFKALLLVSEDDRQYLRNFSQTFYGYRRRQRIPHEEPTLLPQMEPKDRLEFTSETIRMGSWLNAQSDPLIQLFRSYLDPLPRRHQTTSLKETAISRLTLELRELRALLERHLPQD